MDTKKLYQKIKKIAEEQQRDSSVMSRADLAYELKQFGIQGDSLEINKLVYDAYVYYKESPVIRDTFVEMSSNVPIVSTYKLHSALGQANYDSVKTLMQQTLDKTAQSLTTLDNQIFENMTEQAVKVAAGMMNVVTGNSAVVKIQKEANVLFDRYTGMVNGYEVAKNEIETLTKNFVYLRDEIVSIYRNYAAQLIDIFGDSIKSVEPELFDFDAIEWMNVQGMLKNTQLEYSRLSESCTNLMASISENFNVALQKAAGQYRSVNNKGVGLALVGLNLLSHYTNSMANAANLKIDLQKFKNNIHKDGTVIKTDLMRLMSIYKAMNDVNIPRANAFYRFCEKVLNQEFKNLIDSLYDTPELKKLKEERNVLFDNYKQFENLVVDHQMNIDNYKAIIEDNRQLVKNLQDDYQCAMSSKPSKPSAFINFLTFGSKGKSFSRDMFEWQQQYKPTIEKYQNLQVDIKLYQEDLESHQKALKEIEQDYLSKKDELQALNTQIRQAISASKEVKIKVSESLTDIVGLLRLAREIANTRLSDLQMKAIKAPDLHEIAVPESVKNGINALTSVLKVGLETAVDNVSTVGMETLEQLQNSKDERNQMAIDTPNAQDIVKLQSNEGSIDKQDIAQVNAEAIQTVAGIANLFELYSNLLAMKQQSAIALEQYDANMKSLQDQFKQIINGVDDKATLLRNSLKNINLAKDAKQLKSALLSLSNGDINLSEDDIDNFLNGNKKIVL